jgi:RNA polymerase sigma factor (sigma-70 family)
LDDTEEIRWVEASQQGDRQAFCRLVARYGRTVFAVCLSATGRPHDADDLAQEVFVKAYTQIKSLRRADRFGPWLMRISRNTVRDFLRLTRRQETLKPDFTEPHSATQEEPDLSHLRGALAALPQSMRQAVLLYYLDGQDTQSVARAMGISPAGVMTCLSRARRILRERLGAEGGSA